MGARLPQQIIYQIVIEGHLESNWSAWFDGLVITLLEDGTTILVGPLADPTALYGVIAKMRDLGLVLLSLTRIQGEDLIP